MATILKITNPKYPVIRPTVQDVRNKVPNTFYGGEPYDASLLKLQNALNAVKPNKSQSSELGSVGYRSGTGVQHRVSIFPKDLVEFL